VSDFSQGCLGLVVSNFCFFCAKPPFPIVDHVIFNFICKVRCVNDVWCVSSMVSENVMNSSHSWMQHNAIKLGKVCM